MGSPRARRGGRAGRGTRTGTAGLGGADRIAARRRGAQALRAVIGRAEASAKGSDTDPSGSGRMGPVRSGTVRIRRASGETGRNHGSKSVAPASPRLGQFSILQSCNLSKMGRELAR